MASSKLPKLRGLVGMLASIGALLIAAGPASALDSSVIPTAQSAVPAGAAAAIPQSPAAAVPAAAAAAVPSSASAAVPAAGDGSAIASHVLTAVHAQPSASAASGGSGAAAGAPQPDPVPVTAAQPVPTSGQTVGAQPQAAPAPAPGAAANTPEPDRPGSTNARAGHKTSTSGSTTTGRHQPLPPASVTAPAAPRSSAPTLVLRPEVSQPALRTPNTRADVKKGASADRRSRSPKPATVDVSTPVGGLASAPDASPPAGAGAGGIGIGTGAGTAAFLALVALCLLGTLRPGLLGLEIGPWRSAVYALRLERPG